MNTECYNLFVYSSLRWSFKNSSHDYVSRYFDVIGEGKIKGKLYDMGDFPVAMPTREDFYIVGELYKIRNEQEFSYAIAQLDDYEGLIVEEDEFPLYRRALVEVFMGDKSYNAWVYWYNGSAEGRPVIPSGDVIEYLSRKQ